MRATAVFPVNLSADRIDMYRWVTEMTSEDYESYASAHKAMGSYFRGSTFHMVNVECVGTEMLVQQYELLEHSKSHVKFYSRRTPTYLLRWLPVTFSVPWEMTVRPTSSQTCELVCLIGAESANPFLALAARIASPFVRRHLAEEGAAFAKHLERKFAS